MKSPGTRRFGVRRLDAALSSATWRAPCRPHRGAGQQSGVKPPHSGSFLWVALYLILFPLTSSAIQYARPSSTISAGNFTAFGAATLHEATDEVQPNNGDTDYAWTGDDGGTPSCNLGLTSVTDPQSSAGHIIRYVAKAAGSANPVETLTVTLFQGGTAVATSLAQTITRGSYVTNTFTLSAAQADAITNYSILRLSFLPAGIREASAETIRITLIEMEFPNAPAGNPPQLALVTSPFANITTNTALLGATITNDGGAAILSRGTVYGTATDPTGNLLAEGGTGVGTPYSHTRTNLAAGTLYYFRGYATNAAGIGYSTNGQFYTEPHQASSVSFSAVSNFAMTINWVSGGSSGALVVVRAGSAVAASPTDSVQHTASAIFSNGQDLGTSQFVVFRAQGTSVIVTNLTPGETYHVAVFEFAGNGAFINYQQDAPATGNRTLPIIINPPTVTTPTIASVDTTTATLGGTITATNNGIVYERGVFWSTTAGFTPPGQGTRDSTSGTFSTGVFTEAVTAMPAGSRIHFAAFATNIAGYGFSGFTNFYTEPNQASTVTFTAVTNTSMTINWTSGGSSGALVIVRSGSAVTASPTDGVEHASSAVFGSGQDLGSSQFVVFRAQGNSVNVTGLSAGETYHVAVFEFAGNGTGISGINYQQTTPATSSRTLPVVTAVPTVITPTFAAVETTTATLGANLTGTNGSLVTERGVFWSTTTGFTPPGQGTRDSTAGAIGAGLFTEGVTGLPSGSRIFFKAFATNLTGYGFSAETNFFTEPTQVSGITFTLVTNTSMTINWVAGNGSGAVVVVRSGSAVTATPVDGTLHTANAVFGSGEDIGVGEYVVFRAKGTSVNVSGLTQGTTYHVAIFEYAGAVAGENGINYQQDSPAVSNRTTSAPPATPPTINLPSAPLSEIQMTNALLGANVASDGGSALTERGTVWGVALNPTGNKLAEGNTETGVYDHVRGGFSPATLYYFRGYASNGAGIVYTTNFPFYTEPLPASNVAVSAITTGSVFISWSDSAPGAIVVIRVGSPANTPPTDGTLHTANTVFGSGANLGSGQYVVYRNTGTNVTVTGLSPSTLYHISVYTYAGSVTNQINYQETRASDTVTTSVEVPRYRGHNDLHNIKDCNTCHAFHGTFGVARYNEQANVCKTCHNPTGVASNKAAVNVHVVTGGSITNVDCGSCHDVHNGTEAPKGMVTHNPRTGLTKTNLFYFRIDTNYVPQALATGVFHATPSDYAFTNAGGPFNAVCQTCHQNTDHHRQNGTPDVTHNAGADCTTCHGHDGGFKPTGGGDCLGCHNSPQDKGDGGPSRRAMVPEFSLTSHHVMGGAVTTGDCAVCHHEARNSALHQNNAVDLIDPDNDTIVISIPTNFTRNTATDVLESWVTNVQMRFCLHCHDANGASDADVRLPTGGTALRPFSANSKDVPNIFDALAPTNKFHHSVRGTNSNPFCNSTTMAPPWNQSAGEHNRISCWDCHNVSGHGNANRDMLRVNISGVSDGANIEAFCTLCHDLTTYTVNAAASDMGPHDQGQHTFAGGNVKSCRGCHAGMMDDDKNATCSNGGVYPNIMIHGGNHTWAACSRSPGSQPGQFLFGGWLGGSNTGTRDCWGGNCNHTAGGQSW